jgi:hypothetical protein
MKTVSEKNKLTRKIKDIPAFVEKALKEENLMEKYKQRPDYQKNDYIRWITQAKLETTQLKRLAIMLSDLKKGDVYMGMKYNGK